MKLRPRTARSNCCARGSGLPRCRVPRRAGGGDPPRRRGRAGVCCVVQKTGWGKSFVYFIATKLLREAGLRPGAAHLAAAVADAQPDRSRPSAWACGPRPSTPAIGRSGTKVEAAIRATRWTSCSSRPSGSPTSASATRSWRVIADRDRAARDRRGPLHLGLGARLPPALPAARAHRRAPCRRTCGCWRPPPRRTTG